MNPKTKRILRRRALVFDVAAKVASMPRESPPPPNPSADYGRFVVRTCTGCHGETLSGGPIPGAPPSMPTPLNLTPDATGLAGWSFEDFDKLLVQGIRKGGKRLDPFIPIENTSKLDDAEKHALWAYLQSLPPRPLGNR